MVFGIQTDSLRRGGRTSLLMVFTSKGPLEPFACLPEVRLSLKKYSRTSVVVIQTPTFAWEPQSDYPFGFGSGRWGELTTLSLNKSDTERSSDFCQEVNRINREK